MTSSRFDWFFSPLVQVSFLGFVCLCCPGIFNALNGLGAGGSMSSNVTLVDSANGALYGCFCIVGFFAGSIVNQLGIRSCLTISSLGYALYSASLWVYDRKQVSGFVIAAGAILGCCAAVFWAAQGAIMMAYPDEKNKGKFVAIFWALFNIGGILGSVISLGMNINNSAGGVTTGTYTAFVVIMLIGTVISLGLAPPTRVIRSDGSYVAVVHHTSWKDELKGAMNVWREWRMVALFPAFLASNWFYSYQFRVNAVYFDSATRALNGTMYWGMQIFASLAVGALLDYQGFSRRTRGLLTLAIMFCIILAVWIGGFIFQLTFDNSYDSPIHWTTDGFGGPFVLYMLYGFSDAMYQSYLYWLMGAMSNDPTILARYAGFYKALQSAGAAISFGIDACDIPLKWECLISWILVMVSFPFMLMVASKIPDTNVIPEHDDVLSIKDAKTEINDRPFDEKHA
ncbi:major facilitator superfamily domain-containing protein [Halteromyces radiatus]|uniref:major facilitator superfamily domain-containing protein n=1 Tax=Halteromyces radiatus TaxID=101107 RepID=UPI0022205B22|nr:major facilitator superfamily domain-containing protein [Halteromyces radiatus]KAI8098950.1 major facilitator superfamily domain-containing protein [Halteromyces radiatus]